VDKKDKIRSKLFIHQIQELFSATHSHPECPANAATLFRCKHCGKLLTSEQTSQLPCTDSRLEVHFEGQLVWHHERDKEWTVGAYLSSLHLNLSPRDIYWRLWGVVNWLRCSSCGQVFQCSDLSSCSYHPQPPLSGRSSTGPPVHICCGNPPPNVSPFPLPQVHKTIASANPQHTRNTHA
jgi:phage FluMu protein Com